MARPALLMAVQALIVSLAALGVYSVQFTVPDRAALINNRYLQSAGALLAATCLLALRQLLFPSAKLPFQRRAKAKSH